jgi:serine/threonine-protein kinase HipA
MTTSDRAATPERAYVWVWLPGATEPVVAGVLTRSGIAHTFTYGRSYRDRPEAIALYLPELPLQPGTISPPGLLPMASCLRDAGPDAWGQRVILARHLGRLDPSSDTGALAPLTYLLESGSDRIGGLDFQSSAQRYVPRGEDHATLEQMQTAADRLQAGEVLASDLADALLHGTSVGGARPKVTLTDGGRHLIAKLSTQTDTYPVVKLEAVAMDLASRVGLNVAATDLTRAHDRDVLLVQRFDRTGVPGERRLMVSALTVLGLDEFLDARAASYALLADQIRARFTDVDATLHELFGRIVFNICVSNSDDHARNHAAFWDGQALTLTPAYDISPGLRSGDTARQAMAIGRDGNRNARLRVCLDNAEVYHLTRAAARDVIDRIVGGIEAHWKDAADRAQLTEADRAMAWHRLILHPSIHYED